MKPPWSSPRWTQVISQCFFRKRWITAVRELKPLRIVPVPVKVAARSKARVCGRSPAKIVGSNPTGGMDVCLLWASSAVRQRSLRRVDHSSGGVLPTVVCRCVCSRNLANEEALAHWGGCCAKNKRTNEQTNKQRSVPIAGCGVIDVERSG